MPFTPSRPAVLGLLLAFLFGQASAQGVATSVRDLNAAVRTNSADKVSFRLKGLVIPPALKNHVVLQDRTGAQIFYRARMTPQPAVGDLIETTGTIYAGRFISNDSALFTCRRVGKAPVPTPLPATIRDIKLGRFDNRSAVLRGNVLDVLPDDVDPVYCYLILTDGEYTIPVSCLDCDVADLTRRFLRTEVEVPGFCTTATGTLRKFHAHGFWADPESIVVLTPAPDSSSDIPELDIKSYTEPDQIRTVGLRRVDGTVLAAWGVNQVLLRTGAGETVRAALRPRLSLPPAGRSVRLVGLPETDMFNVNLASAAWTELTQPAASNEAPVAVSVRRIFSRDKRRLYNTRYHGRIVRISGIVTHVPQAGGSPRLQLESEGEIVSIDVSACPEIIHDIATRCEVEATGACVMETENWRPTNPFPSVRDYFLVLRNASDLTILSRPPWWTTTRLSLLCGILLLALAVFVVWNRVLRHLVLRRSRELFRSQIDKVGATLRIEERTRLAVELHDSLSQNLTAVSFQISAAVSLRQSDPETSAVHLANANRMLKSCRTELKNCLFDLRGNTLEEPDFAEAVRRTLAVFEGQARISIRFNVPRTRCNDTTVHAILRIIRELVANAIRHGKATSVRIAGDRQSDVVSFSVRDNGCGFAVDEQLGIRNGCFGLQGIRERVRQLGGAFTLTSAPGRGTYAVIRLTAPSPSVSTASPVP